MSTFVERNFRVKAVVDCAVALPDGTIIKNLEGIEVQLWRQAPMQSIFLGKGITNSEGEFVIDVLIDSPVDFIEDGQIKEVFTKMYYNGELLSEPEHLYDPDAQLYFDQLTPQPSSAYKEAINDLVLQLKGDGNWNKLDRLWIFATEYQQHASISLANPLSTAISEVGSPTWTADQGYTGNGTSSYINTNYNSSTGIHYQRNDASFGCYSRVSINAFKVNLGVTDGSCLADIVPRNGGSLFAVANGGTFISATVSSSVGLSHVKRTGANTEQLYKNGASVQTGTSSSVALPNYNFYVLARNSSGTASTFSNDQVSLVFVGGGGIDQSAIYDAIQAFATARGFNI